MKVKFNQSVATPGICYVQGHEYEVSDVFGQSLVNSGQATADGVKPDPGSLVTLPAGTRLTTAPEPLTLPAENFPAPLKALPSSLTRDDPHRPPAPVSSGLTTASIAATAAPAGSAQVVVDPAAGKVSPVIDPSPVIEQPKIDAAAIVDPAAGKKK